MMLHTNFNEKIFKIGKVFYLCRFKYGFWFRIFNRYGLHGKNIRVHGVIR